MVVAGIPYLFLALCQSSMRTADMNDHKGHKSDPFKFCCNIKTFSKNFCYLYFCAEGNFYSCYDSVTTNIKS